MHTHQTVEGVDVELTFSPDAPKKTQLITAELLQRLDAVATEAARINPDWHVELALGPDNDPFFITASPALPERTAA